MVVLEDSWRSVTEAQRLRSPAGNGGEELASGELTSLTAGVGPAILDVEPPETESGAPAVAGGEGPAAP